MNQLYAIPNKRVKLYLFWKTQLIFTWYLINFVESWYNLGQIIYHILQTGHLWCSGFVVFNLINLCKYSTENHWKWFTTMYNKGPFDKNNAKQIALCTFFYQKVKILPKYENFLRDVSIKIVLQKTIWVFENESLTNTSTCRTFLEKLAYLHVISNQFQKMLNICTYKFTP